MVSSYFIFSFDNTHVYSRKSMGIYLAIAGHQIPKSNIVAPTEIAKHNIDVSAKPST